MRLKPAEVERFLKSPPQGIRAALFYGPDQGLVNERARRLLRNLTDTPDDAFSVTELDESALRGDPARLADEAGSVAMFGGRRVVRVRDAGESAAKALAGFLEVETGDGFVIIEAGDLAPRAGLRKKAEAAKDVAAIGCYADNPEAVEAMAAAMLREAGLEIPHDALLMLASQLGADRMLSRQEIEKLILYKNGESPVTIEDVEATVGGGEARNLDDAIDAAAEGNMARLDTAYNRLVEAGVTPEQMIRMLTMHLERLHLVLGRLERGGRLDEIIKSLRPPLHFRRADAMRRQCAVWSRRRLDGALQHLADAEAESRGAGSLTPAVVGRAMMSIARAAAQNR